MVNEKAVAVARDVIAHLDGFMQGSCYLYKPYSRCHDFPKTGDAQLYIEAIAKDCYMCALGAALLSAIRLYDQVDISRLMAGFVNFKEVSINSDRVVRHLSDVFDRDTIWAIEAAYERTPWPRTWGDATPLTDNDSPSFLRDASDYGCKFNNARDRVNAIMSNIIVNGGRFDPTCSSPYCLVDSENLPA